MRQKLSMLLALLIQPKALLVDEPMVGLDPASIEAVLQLFIRLKEQGTSVLISTHIIDVVNDIWDCAYIMKQGEIVREIHRGEEGSETLKQIFFETTAGESMNSLMYLTFTKIKGMIRNQFRSITSGLITIFTVLLYGGLVIMVFAGSKSYDPELMGLDANLALWPALE